MPVARYFLFVGGALLALLFLINAIVPQAEVATNASLSAPAVDKSTVRIQSTQKLPERVVFDTSLPAVPSQQASGVAAAPPAATTPDLSAKARVRDTFAQFVPAEAKNRPAAAADAKPLEQQAQAMTPPAPKKRRVAKVRANPPTQLQAMRFAQPGLFQPYRVAQQQQQRYGLFGFGTW
ncbi:hypothetical protein [Bradyrhizobium lablabi]|uniref:hypothetical protein n=1 Tax=Bradyrhizobium lablabi TaxID=722472 RepID=UPI001BABE8C8|nr:hypothetical protein [Bradyrhizobium lablabi]MBR0692583.1 hypothetical protein [Bradyrhizobium lablabi]